MKKLLPLLLVAAIMITVVIFIACEQQKTDETPLEIKDYIIVRPDIASEMITESAVQLKNALAECGQEITIQTDWIKEGVSEGNEYEILVGNTSREETAQVLSTLAENEYAIKLVGTKLVIVGASDLGTQNAINAFLAGICTISEGSVNVSRTLDVKNTFLTPYNVTILNSSSIITSSGFLDNDVTRLFTCFQGLQNRDSATTRKFIYQDLDKEDAFWLDYMTGEDKFMTGASSETISTWSEFTEKYMDDIKNYKIILWDTNVPATSNVASTICGLDGYLPVKYDTAEGSLYNYLIGEGVEVAMSLVGKFSGEGTVPDTDIKSSGSTKCDAYIWAVEKYMDRCSTTHIAYTLDGAGTIPENDIYKNSEGHNPQYNAIFSHDYYVMLKMFFFDLNVIGDERPCDDKEQPMGADRRTAEFILQTMYERANGEMIQLLGFPPWWMKYTTFHNNGKTEPVTLEWTFTEFITAFNCIKEADAAHPAWMTNGSVYTYYPLKESYTNTKPTTKMTFEEDTRYYMIYLGDYDSSAWMKRSVPGFFTDSARGSLPLAWGFNSNLSDRIPMAWDYVMENATANDYFIMGDSGAGYVQPASLFKGKLRDNPDCDNEWLEYNRKYNGRFGLDICGFIIMGWNPLTDKVMELYNEIAPIGSLTNVSSQPLTIFDDVPYVYMYDINSDAADVGRTMFNQMNGKRTSFSAFRTICKSPTSIKTAVEACAAYADESSTRYDVVYVDPYTFFDLIRQSGEGRFVN